MKNLIIILDPAHGEEVPGKRSPDGTHREYRWSRERIKVIKESLERLGYEVVLTNTTDREIGLDKRRNFATNYKKGQKKLLLSLHNDASANTGWGKARGYSVWTTRGVTKSDECAEIILQQFEKDFPEIKKRVYSPTQPHRDFEADFAVIRGADYMGVLIEWLFQDNQEDLVLLKDAELNSRYEASIVKAVERINEVFN